MTEVQPDLDTKRIGLDLIPAGSQMHQGASQSLDIDREWTPDRITVVLCDEALGF
jgi:hypothetical protein